MSVTQEYIANVLGVDPDTVRCDKCKSYQKGKYSFELPFCEFLGIQTFDDNFCPFWRKNVRIKR